MKVLQKVGAAFTAKYKIPVNVQEVPLSNQRDQFTRDAPAGKGPDLMVGPHDALGGYVSNGLLEPLVIPTELKPQFVESSLDAFQYKQKQYGLPYSSAAVALVYNKNLVPKPPTTWAQLKTIATNLQSSGKAKYGFVLLDANPFFAEALFTGFGGGVFAITKDHRYNPKKVLLDSPGSIAAANEIHKMIVAGLLHQGVDYEALQNTFKAGQVGMAIDGPWSLANMKSSGVPFGVVPIPPMTGTARPFVGVNGFMLSAFSKNKLVAKTFLLNFVSTAKVQQMLYNGYPQPSAWKSVNAKIKDPAIKGFAASAANGQPTPAIPQMEAVWDAWTKATAALFANQGTPADVMKQAAAVVRDRIRG